MRGLAGRQTVGAGELGDEYPLVPVTPTTSRWTFTQMVIYLVGFSEGLTHLAALAIYYLFKDDLGLSPPEVSAIFAVPALPWVIKPVFAFLSDSVPIFGYRRKPYMIFFSALQAFAFVLLGMSGDSVIQAVLCLLLVSTASAFCSAVAEALLVESTMGKSLDEGSDNVSDFITSKAFGSLLVAYLSGYLLERTSKAVIFYVTASFPLLITVTCCFMHDPASVPTADMRLQITRLYQFLKNPIVWGPAVYIFVYTCGPDYDDALFFFYTNELGLSPTFMGTLRFTYGIAAIIGIMGYKTFFKNTSFRSILLWTIIISVPVYISPILLITGWNRYLGISDQAFVLSGGFLTEATAEIQLLPLLIMTASICPPGLEGSVYGMMMSIRNIGSAVSKGASAICSWSLGITATDFSNLTILVIICGAFLILPLLFLDLVPTDEQVQEIKVKHDEEQKKAFFDA